MIKQRMPDRKSYVARQRGAIGILGILTLLVAILFAVVAVDTGRLMLQRQHLQTVADMAALDASSQTGSCGSDDMSAIEALADASAARNNYNGGALTVQLGQVSVGANGVREFSQSAIETATAVRVEAAKTVPASLFAGGILGNDVTLRAEAVAEREAIAGFSAGSLLVSLSTEESALLNSLLGGLLGSSVDLGVLAYQGIAATQLSLLELVDASASAGNVEELLNADLSVAQWLNLYADAVAASGAADVDVTAGLAELVGASVNNLNAQFSDILNLTTDNPESAADADVNLLDLIMTTAQVANGSNAVTLPLAVNLPAGLLNVGVQLNITEPPQIAIGPPGQDEDGDWLTQMHTAQVELSANIQSTIDLSVLGLVGAEANVDLGLLVEVAQGDGWLKSIECATVNSNQSEVTIGAQPGVADINLTRASDQSATGAGIDVSAVVLGLRIPVAEVEVELNLPLQNPGSTELSYEVNPRDEDDLPQTQLASTATGQALADIADDLQLDITLLGAVSLPLGTLTDALLGQILAPILSALGTAIIDPLLSVLGIEIGSLEVKLFALEIDRPEMQR